MVLKLQTGHGIETSDWLETSMSNGTAMKLWNLNLGSKAMPYKPWLWAWARVAAKQFFVCLALLLAYLRSVPHCVPNKAHAKAGTHTLLATQM